MSVTDKDQEFPSCQKVIKCLLYTVPLFASFTLSRGSDGKRHSDCAAIFFFAVAVQGTESSVDTLKKEAEKQVWAHYNLNLTCLPCSGQAHTLFGGVWVWGWVSC